MILEIEKISQINEENINFNSIIFKIQTDNTINYKNANTISVLLYALITGGAIKIIINMKSLKYIDSSGIGALIKYTKYIRKNNGNIVLCNVSQEIHEVFTVINLHKFTPIFKTEVEAINSFRYV